jgi:hypothetical protein
MNGGSRSGRTSARPDTTRQWLRWWADLLDSRFRIPGTAIRFGLDPIFALVPGLGDLSSPVFAVALLVQGLHQRVPKVILLRMVLNALLDAFIGAVPLAGPVADIFFRANTRNLALLERHAQQGIEPRRSDYIFVFGIAALFGMLALIPVAIAIWLAAAFWAACCASPV